ncbi:MAG: hypothetical protein F6K39_23950 [Okeania sp. SIO3B3]|nr:hypothetical protein [Okeania sp. SIO3B3]
MQNISVDLRRKEEEGRVLLYLIFKLLVYPQLLICRYKVFNILQNLSVDLRRKEEEGRRKKEEYYFV